MPRSELAQAMSLNLSLQDIFSEPKSLNQETTPEETIDISNLVSDLVSKNGQTQINKLQEVLKSLKSKGDLDNLSEDAKLQLIAMISDLTYNLYFTRLILDNTSNVYTVHDLLEVLDGKNNTHDYKSILLLIGSWLRGEIQAGLHPHPIECVVDTLYHCKDTLGSYEGNLFGLTPDYKSPRNGQKFGNLIELLTNAGIDFDLDEAKNCQIILMYLKPMYEKAFGNDSSNSNYLQVIFNLIATLEQKKIINQNLRVALMNITPTLLELDSMSTDESYIKVYQTVIDVLKANKINITALIDKLKAEADKA